MDDRGVGLELPSLVIEPSFGVRPDLGPLRLLLTKGSGSPGALISIGEAASESLEDVGALGLDRLPIGLPLIVVSGPAAIEVGRGGDLQIRRGDILCGVLECQEVASAEQC